MESLVQSRVDVSAALVAGPGRFEAVLFIEPLNVSVTSSRKKAGFIERLWPTIKEVNHQSPTHVRVSESHTLFPSLEKPVSRAGKGTVQGRFTLENYFGELDSLYADADPLSNLEVPAKINTKNLEGSVLQVLMTTGVPDLEAVGDFFVTRGGSMQVIQTARSLRRD